MIRYGIFLRVRCRKRKIHENLNCLPVKLLSFFTNVRNFSEAWFLVSFFSRYALKRYPVITVRADNCFAPSWKWLTFWFADRLITDGFAQRIMLTGWHSQEMSKPDDMWVLQVSRIRNRWSAPSYHTGSRELKTENHRSVRFLPINSDMRYTGQWRRVRWSGYTWRDANQNGYHFQDGAKQLSARTVITG